MAEGEEKYLTNSVVAPPYWEEDGRQGESRCSGVLLLIDLLVFGVCLLSTPGHHTFNVSLGKKDYVSGPLSQAQGKCISENRELYQAIMVVFSEFERKVCIYKMYAKLETFV